MVRWSCLWVSVLWGCGPDRLATLESGDPAVREGSDEAVAVLRMLADGAVTQAVLDDDAGLDARAARGLIARRDGADGAFGTSDDRLFQSIAEVDAVPYVGPAAVRALADFAREGGWFEAGPVVIEGVGFTAEQAEATLALANTASVATLDDAVGLDSRAASGIVARRPFADLTALGAVPYVGASALTALRDYASVGAVDAVDAATALAVLDDSVPGLWFTSETDAPLVVVHLPGGGASPLTLQDAAARLAVVAEPGRTPLAELALEERTVESVFARYTDPEDWWEPYQLDEQPTWARIRAVFDEDLADSQVFRFGQPMYGGVGGLIQVFVIGVTAEGDLVGVRTLAVET